MNRDLALFVEQLLFEGERGRGGITQAPDFVSQADQEQASNDDRDDHTFLQDIADANTYEVITITYVSGATWQGDGTITDSLEFSSQNSTAELTLGGPDKLTKQ